VRHLRASHLLFVLLATPSCGSLGSLPPFPNVRPYQVHGAERPSAIVVESRIHDVEAAFRLSHDLLHSVRYCPDDRWPELLALSPPQAEELKARLSSHPAYQAGDHRIPFLSMLVAHVGSVVEQSAAPSSRHVADECKPILEWIEAGVPAARGLRANLAGLEADEAEQARLQRLPAWAPQRRPGGSRRRELLAALDQYLAAIEAAGNDRSRQRLLRDALLVTGTSLRLQREARALIPLIRDQGEALTASDPSTPWEVIQEIGARADALYQPDSEPAFSPLERLGGALGRATGQPLDAALGTARDESLDDDLAGFSWDWVHVRMEAQAEVTVFDPSKGGGDAPRNLKYEIEPILLVGASLAVSVDGKAMADVVRFAADYRTDRTYRSGGAVEQTSLSRALNLSSTASDVVDLAASALGVKTSATIARFTSGTVREVQSSDGSVIAEAPLQPEVLRIDAGYDVLAGRDPQTGGPAVVGLRYYNYVLPRIVVETAGQADNETVVRASDPQSVRTQLLMAGGYLDQVWRLYSSAPWGMRVMIGGFLGGGPASFSMAPGDDQTRFMVAGDAQVGFGVRYDLRSVHSRWAMSAELSFVGDIIGSTSPSQKTSYEFQSSDMFGSAWARWGLSL
jgi:hypothetical protein